MWGVYEESTAALMDPCLPPSRADGPHRRGRGPRALGPRPESIQAYMGYFTFDSTFSNILTKLLTPDSTSHSSVFRRQPQTWTCANIRWVPLDEYWFQAKLGFCCVLCEVVCLCHVNLVVAQSSALLSRSVVSLRLVPYINAKFKIQIFPKGMFCFSLIIRNMCQFRGTHRVGDSIKWDLGSIGVHCESHARGPVPPALRAFWRARPGARVHMQSAFVDFATGFTT